MNLKQLNKQVGSNLRLRPSPIRIGPDGSQIPQADDQWRLEKILNDPTRIRLVNISTGHSIELHPDNVREYRTPDFLLLRCKLLIKDQMVEIEPIVGTQKHTTEPLTNVRAKRASVRFQITSSGITISDMRNISRVEEIVNGTLRLNWTGEFLNPDYEIMAAQTRNCSIDVIEKTPGNAVISIRQWQSGAMEFVIHAQGEESSTHFSESWSKVEIFMWRGGQAEICPVRTEMG